MPNPVVAFETSQGNFEVTVYQDKSPVTVQNFLQYVNDKFYDNTIFHRVINGFMVQGGGFDANGSQKSTRAPIKNESSNGVKNVKYGVAMARTSDLNSATAQFFVNVVDNAFLDDNQYCAFGLVTSGTDTIEKIKGVKTGTKNGNKDWPLENVVLKSARVKA